MNWTGPGARHTGDVVAGRAAGTGIVQPGRRSGCAGGTAMPRTSGRNLQRGSPRGTLGFLELVGFLGRGGGAGMAAENA